jgi:hypothetical protein
MSDEQTIRVLAQFASAARLFILATDEDDRLDVSLAEYLRRGKRLRAAHRALLKCPAAVQAIRAEETKGR